MSKRAGKKAAAAKTKSKAKAKATKSGKKMEFATVPQQAENQLFSSENCSEFEFDPFCNVTELPKLAPLVIPEAKAAKSDAFDEFEDDFLSNDEEEEPRPPRTQRIRNYAEISGFGLNDWDAQDQPTSSLRDLLQGSGRYNVDSQRKRSYQEDLLSEDDMGSGLEDGDNSDEFFDGEDELEKLRVLAIPDSTRKVARGRRRQKQLRQMSTEERKVESLNKKEKARKSARDCRARKKQYIGKLEKYVKTMKHKDHTQQKEIERLRTRIRHLERNLGQALVCASSSTFLPG